MKKLTLLSLALLIGSGAQTVLGFNQKTLDYVKTYKKLPGTRLEDKDLSYANLSNANFYKANLSKANLSDAALSNAKLSNAKLSKANLSNADLSNADLSQANVTGADFTGAISIINANIIGGTNNHKKITKEWFRAANTSGWESVKI